MKEREPDVGENAEPDSPERRRFLERATTAAMVGGVASAYGGVGVVALRFLHPGADDAGRWVLVAPAADLEVGSARPFEAPSGAAITIVRQDSSDDGFIALSSVCPHLGCSVYWQSQSSRFFCPCHNGSFDAVGRPTGGPPLSANQELLRYPLRVVDGLLYIALPNALLASALPIVDGSSA